MHSAGWIKYFVNKVLSKLLSNSKKNSCAGVSFYKVVDLQVLRLPHKDFLVNFANFWEHFI